jgi:hypothetical protein
MTISRIVRFLKRLSNASMGYFFYCKGVLISLPRVSSVSEGVHQNRLSEGLFDRDAA